MPQKRQVLSDFALIYIFLLRSCNGIGAFIILRITFRFVRRCPLSKVPSLHRHYPALSLLYTSPTPSHLLFLSELYPVIEEVFLLEFLQGWGGSLQLLLMSYLFMSSLQPRWRNKTCQLDFVLFCCFRPIFKSSTFRLNSFTRLPLCSLALQPEQSHRFFSIVLSIGFSIMISHHTAILVTRL